MGRHRCRGGREYRGWGSGYFGQLSVSSELPGVLAVTATDYRYDCTHRLVSLRDPNYLEVSYQYDAAGRGQEVFDIAEAQRKPMVEPHRSGDGIGWESVSTVVRILSHA